MANLTVMKEVNALLSLSPKFRTDLFLTMECEEPWAENRYRPCVPVEYRTSVYFIFTEHELG
jgi:hypothetical protein